MLRHALVLASKDLKHFYRDRGAVVGGYLAPIVLLVIFGIIYSNMFAESSQMRIDLLFVDKENSDQSARFLASLESEDAFEVTSTVQDEGGMVALTEETARDMILDGKAHLALVYERTEFLPESTVAGLPALTLYYDPSSDMEREITAGLLTRTVFQSTGGDLPHEGLQLLLNQSELKDTPAADSLLNLMDQLTQSEEGSSSGMTSAMEGMINIDQQEVVREEVRQGNPFMANTVAGLVVMFLLFSVSYSAVSLLKEQQEGTIRRLLFAPISVDSIVLGKFLAISLNSFLQVLVMLAASTVVFDVNVLGNIGPVLIMVIATVAATTSFGMIIAAVAPSYEQIQAMILLIVLTMSAVGGSMFPRILMPPWMKDVGLFTLNGWAIDGFLDALYLYKGPGSILGYGEAHSFSDFIHNSEALVLLILALVFGVVASRILSRRLRGGAGKRVREHTAIP